MGETKETEALKRETDKIQEKAQKLLTHKEQNVRELAEQFLKIYSKPEYDSFVSLMVQYNNWLAQFKEKQIDLFSVEQKPIFEVAHKFFSEMKPYIDMISYLQSKLTKEEVETAKVAANAYERNLQKRGVIDGE